MKTKAAVVGPNDQALQREFSSRKFAESVLQEVCGIVLGVPNILERPAEFYVQQADIGVSVTDDVNGVEIRLTGISRDGRTPKQFHDALKRLYEIAKGMIFYLALDRPTQVFCVLMLDGEIEVAPDTGKYSDVIEGRAVVVNAHPAKTGS